MPYWVSVSDAHVVGTRAGVLDVTFFDPGTPAWFEARIDEKSGRTLTLRMIATAHFMQHVYGPFNAPIHLHASGCVGLEHMSVPDLDPQIIKAMRQAEKLGYPSPETVTPEEARENYAKLVAEQFGPVDEVYKVEDLDAEGVPVRVYRPVKTKEPERALIYFHGGGYVVGSVDTHDGICRAIAKRAETIVVSVDYRLAPEHKYPAAIDDCWQATRWVFANAKELGIDETRVGVGGDSVGGRPGGDRRSQGP